MKESNNIIQTKLSIDRCLNQLSHIQAMFLFCEPRNIGMDHDVAEGIIDLISKVRRELRQTHERLENTFEQNTSPAMQAA